MHMLDLGLLKASYTTSILCFRKHLPSDFAAWDSASPVPRHRSLTRARLLVSPSTRDETSIPAYQYTSVHKDPIPVQSKSNIE